MLALETSFFRIHPNRILGLSRARKWVQSAIRPFAMSLYRLQTRPFLGWSRGKKWVGIP